MSLSAKEDLRVLYRDVFTGSNGNLHDIDLPYICNKIFIAVKKILENLPLQKNVQYIKMSFEVIGRMITKLVKIYYEQVENLLSLTQKLNSNGNYTTMKRKTRITSRNYGKRSRLIVSQTTKNYRYISFDAKLLNNLQEFKSDSENCLKESINEACHYLEQTEEINHGSLTDLQINEYSVEISNNFRNENFLYNEFDDGFGNATEEDLLQFYNISKGFNEPVKLRALFQNSDAGQHQFMQPHYNDKTNNSSNFCGTISDKIDTSNNNYLAETNVQVDNNEILQAQQVNSLPVDIRRSTLSNNSSQLTEEPQSKHHQVNTVLKAKKKKKRGTTYKVINKNNQISKKEMRKRMFKKLGPIDLKKRKLKSSLNIAEQSTVNVLTHLAKCNSKIKVHKRPIDVVQPVFRDLLYSVLGEKVDYDRWEDDLLEPQFKTEQLTPSLPLSDQTFPEQVPSLNEDSILDDNGNNIREDMPIQFGSGIECHTWTVMMKLLDMWRYAGYDKINASLFCKSAGSRLNIAVTFGALMVLVAKRFIIITKEADSIEIKDILLGPASLELINQTCNESRN